MQQAAYGYQGVVFAKIAGEFKVYHKWINLSNTFCNQFSTLRRVSTISIGFRGAKVKARGGETQWTYKDQIFLSRTIRPF
jgi:hypothetical protein